MSIVFVKQLLTKNWTCMQMTFFALSSLERLRLLVGFSQIAHFSALPTEYRERYEELVDHYRDQMCLM